MTGELRDFRVEIPQARLDDLYRRLDTVRWPQVPNGVPWQFGPDPVWMRQLFDRWRTGYDWRAWEARLNTVPNRMVRIDGQDIHFLIEQGSGPDPLPLLLLHGWPGSIVEFLEVIGPLAHPERHGGQIEDAFTVIVPSLPGFGFSPAPAGPMRPAAMAGLFAKLMTEVLNFDRYVVQGGDWGAIIASWMALDHSARLQAIHLNSPGLAGGHPRPEPEDNPLCAEEKAWWEADQARRRNRLAYQDIQGTEPLTLAYALSDSPVGLAAWIAQRFHDWTVWGSADGPPFESDHLLTNIMLYWLAGPGSSTWLYVSTIKGQARNMPPGRRVEVPARFLLCPNDNTIPAPPPWLNRAFARIVSRDVAERGGHFLAFEQPGLFVSDIAAFFRAFR